MLIRVVCQRAFARGHMVNDEGDEVFLMCNDGLANMIGIDHIRKLFGRSRLKRRDEFVMDVECKYVNVIRIAGLSPSNPSPPTTAGEGL